jgi:hypothetical protein
VSYGAVPVATRGRGQVRHEECSMATRLRRHARTNGAVQPQPLIAVRDVKASSSWHRQLLNLKSGHGGREYERLLCDGELVMQLHAWNAEEHPNLTDPPAGARRAPVVRDERLRRGGPARDRSGRARARGTEGQHELRA